MASVEANPETHLNWESLSQPIAHVPVRSLYVEQGVKTLKMQWFGPMTGTD